MKIFLSWSGVRSRHIADSLRDWLPNVIQALEPFISTQDIKKGSRGSNIIMEQLEDSNIGLICLTPENVGAPWILFEAGALSKLAVAHVCTVLHDLGPSDVPPPLGQFQHTTTGKMEIKALVETINGLLPSRALDQHRLVASFEAWWPSFEQALNSTPARQENEHLPDARTEQSKIDEILGVVRRLDLESSMTPIIKSTSFVRPFHLSEDDLRPFLENVGSGVIHADAVKPEVLDQLLQNGLVSVDQDRLLNLTKRGNRVVRKSVDA